MMSLSDVKATLSFSDGSPTMDLPIYKGSIGPDVIDIRKLYAQTGKFTYDPGFLSTASCNSTITYIDGDKGELMYRGYPIEQLAANCDFLETCYLLLNGELPGQQELDDFGIGAQKQAGAVKQRHIDGGKTKHLAIKVNDGLPVSSQGAGGQGQFHMVKTQCWHVPLLLLHCCTAG